MVWRQLPKLVPAGSIPVSRSKKTEEQKLFRFCIAHAAPHKVKCAAPRAVVWKFVNRIIDKNKGKKEGVIQRAIFS